MKIFLSFSRDFLGELNVTPPIGVYDAGDDFPFGPTVSSIWLGISRSGEAVSRWAGLVEMMESRWFLIPGLALVAP